MKEWFKSKAYWLRGGIVAVGIYILFTLALIPFIGEGYPAGSGAFIPAIPAVFLLDIFDVSYIPGLGIFISIILYSTILSIIIYFLIGALIGWIVGKIKSKNVE